MLREIATAQALMALAGSRGVFDLKFFLVVFNKFKRVDADFDIKLASAWLNGYNQRKKGIKCESPSVLRTMKQLIKSSEPEERLKLLKKIKKNGQEMPVSSERLIRKVRSKKTWTRVVMF